jgi:hypothetical protein
MHEGMSPSSSIHFVYPVCPYFRRAHESPPLGIILRMVSGLVSSCLPLSLSCIDEYFYILIAACLVFAQRISSQQRGRGMLRSVAQRSDDNLRCMERQRSSSAASLLGRCPFGLSKPSLSNQYYLRYFVRPLACSVYTLVNIKF